MWFYMLEKIWQEPPNMCLLHHLDASIPESNNWFSKLKVIGLLKRKIRTWKEKISDVLMQQEKNSKGTKVRSSRKQFNNNIRSTKVQPTFIKCESMGWYCWMNLCRLMFTYSKTRFSLFRSLWTSSDLVFSIQTTICHD